MIAKISVIAFKMSDTLDICIKALSLSLLSSLFLVSFSVHGPLSVEPWPRY